MLAEGGALWEDVAYLGHRGLYSEVPCPEGEREMELGPVQLYHG